MYIKLDNKKISLKQAKSFKDNFLGLMGKSNFDYGIIFRCNGIHTFFMKEKIDVLLLDKNYKVLYVIENLGKNRILLPKRGVYYTIELPVNSIKKIRIGEKVQIRS